MQSFPEVSDARLPSRKTNSGPKEGQQARKPRTSCEGRSGRNVVAPPHPTQTPKSGTKQKITRASAGRVITTSPVDHLFVLVRSHTQLSRGQSCSDLVLPGCCNKARTWNIPSFRRTSSTYALLVSNQHGGFPKWGYPRMDVYNGKSHHIMDDLGAPPF